MSNSWMNRAIPEGIVGFDSLLRQHLQRWLPGTMRGLDGEGPFAAPPYTHRGQTQEIEFGPSSPHVSSGQRRARAQPQLRSDSQPEGTGSHA